MLTFLSLSFGSSEASEGLQNLFLNFQEPTQRDGNNLKPGFRLQLERWSKKQERECRCCELDHSVQCFSLFHLVFRVQLCLSSAVSVVNLTSEMKASPSSSSGHDNSVRNLSQAGRRSRLVKPLCWSFCLLCHRLTEPSHQRELLKAENHPKLRFTPPASVTGSARCHEVKLQI